MSPTKPECRECQNPDCPFPNGHMRKGCESGLDADGMHFPPVRPYRLTWDDGTVRVLKLCEVCADAPDGNSGAVEVVRASRLSRLLSALTGAAVLMMLSPALMR